MNYVKNLLTLVSTVNGPSSVSAFTSWVCIPVGNTISSVETKDYAILAEIQKYYQIIKKQTKEHDKIAFLEKDRLNTIEIVTSNRFTYQSWQSCFSK